MSISEIERLSDAMGAIPVDTFDVPEAECRNFLEVFAHAVRFRDGSETNAAAEPHRERARRLYRSLGSARPPRIHSHRQTVNKGAVI